MASDDEDDDPYAEFETEEWQPSRSSFTQVRPSAAFGPAEPPRASPLPPSPPPPFPRSQARHSAHRC